MRRQHPYRFMRLISGATHKGQHMDRRFALARQRGTHAKLEATVYPSFLDADASNLKVVLYAQRPGRASRAG